jgi:predicted Rossmann fold nucleotide-binding protein DprA/Smf involved in DNA uptake
VTKGERLASEAALCALYLRGAPVTGRSSRRRWPLVVDALRSACPSVPCVSDVLRGRGLYEESCVLADPHLMQWALDVCASSRALTCLDPLYPQGWLASLGSGAPPCVWVRGALPSAPAVGVVGSRVLTSSDRAFAAGTAQLLLSSGRALVSGGAVGADSVALSAALALGGEGRCVEVLPCGLDAAPVRPGVCQLSVCEPWAAFTTGQAMERNALIYSFGRRAVVVRARLREGGTWHGAADALRRRLGSVLVRSLSSDPASRALVALGAVPVASLAALRPLLDSPVAPGQPALFGSSVVRAPAAAYG